METFHQDMITVLGLGRDPKALTFEQIACRGIVVFLVYPCWEPRLDRCDGERVSCGECQDFCAAFQAVGVSSATRFTGQSPSLGSTSLK